MDAQPVVTPAAVAVPLRLVPFRAVMLAPSRIGSPMSARAFARPYRSVSRRLTQWARQGVVEKDAAPALYLHEYTVGQITIRGLVGALDVSRRASRTRERAVWPHEGIHPRQVDELAARMSEMGVNPAPILLVHRGPERLRRLFAEVSDREPQWAFTDRAGQRQRIWAIREAADHDLIAKELGTGRALIADGHHRYAAYLKLQESHPGTPWDLGLTMLVDQDDTPLFLGAIHRTLAGADLASFSRAVLDAGGELRRGPQAEVLAALAPRTMVATDGESWCAVHLPDAEDRAAVEWVHERLLPVTGPSATAVAFHHSAEAAQAQLENTPGVALLMPAPDFDEVLDVISDGRLLPEKATSFQPKPSLGVLMRDLADERVGPSPRTPAGG